MFVSLSVFTEKLFRVKPATVAEHVAHPLVVGKVIGLNLGPTPRQN